METLKDKAGMAVASAGEFNQLAIDKVEEIAKLNLATAAYFSDLGIKQLRGLSGIKDMESMRKFTADTISLSGEVAKKMLDDGRAWMVVGADAKEKVTSLFAKKDEPEARKKTAGKPAAVA
jgi:phasin family protein